MYEIGADKLVALLNSRTIIPRESWSDFIVEIRTSRGTCVDGTAK